MGTPSTRTVAEVRRWLDQCDEFTLFVPWADETIRIDRREAERLLDALGDDATIQAYRSYGSPRLELG